MTQKTIQLHNSKFLLNLRIFIVELSFSSLCFKCSGTSFFNIKIKIAIIKNPKLTNVSIMFKIDFFNIYYDFKPHYC